MICLNAQANTTTRKLTKRGYLAFHAPPFGGGEGEGPVEPVGLVIVRRWHNIGTNWILNY